MRTVRSFAWGVVAATTPVAWHASCAQAASEYCVKTFGFFGKPSSCSSTETSLSGGAGPGGAFEGYLGPHGGACAIGQYAEDCIHPAAVTVSATMGQEFVVTAPGLSGLASVTLHVDWWRYCYAELTYAGIWSPAVTSPRSSSFASCSICRSFSLRG